MADKTLTLTLVILILLAVLWTSGHLQKIFDAAFGGGK